ncbi:MAG: YEATS-associated helix-containing protein [Terriglobia bacterium]
MTRYNMILLLVAMIGSGVLGGAANFLILHKDDPEYAKRSRSIVLGLVASLLVPISLKTIASDMIDKISNIRYGSGVPFDFFVFTSLCLLAAVYSRTVVETVAKRLSAEVEKAKRESKDAKTRALLAEERASQSEPVLRQEMEQRTEPLPESARNSVPPSLQDLPVDHTDRELLNALFGGQYSYRTVSSLANEVQVEELDAIMRLERMREHALAGKKTTPTRNLWFLTDKGCNWLEAQAPREELPRDRNVM